MFRKNAFLSLLPTIISLLLSIGVMTVFSACGAKDDGTWMRCHSVQNSVAVCGAVIALLFAAAALIKSNIVRFILNAAALAGSVLVFLLPGGIMPMCMMATMRCYTVMRPFARIMALIIAITAVHGLIRALRNKSLS